MNGIKIKNMKKMSLNDNFNKYLKPEFVYIPLIINNDFDITDLVKKGDYVFKGQAIGRSKGSKKMQIISSVSGIVDGYADKYYSNGNLVRCCIIKNDYKELEENIDIKDDISNISKKDFIKLLKEKGIVGMSGNGFPTYLKYESDNLKTLIVNAVECDPYITADYFLIKHFAEEILETVDAIININNLNEAIIVVSNRELIKIFNNYIGTYLKIKIKKIPLLYPNGWERKIIKLLNFKDYDKYPSEIGVVVNNVSTIYSIYNALKYNKALTERIITITGSGIKTGQNILVKIGSLASDVIKKNEGFNENLTENIFVSGGAMMGSSIPSSDLVISAATSAILVTNKLDENVIRCIRCGKCISHCPAYLFPVLIKDNINNKKMLSKLNPIKCIECGICSYVCPSKINVREVVKIAKKKMEDD